MIKNKKDICVIGIGRFGFSLVKQLVELKKQVLAIDIDESKLKRASRLVNTTILDATDIEALKDIGVDKFDIVIVAVSENIEIVASLIELKVNYIIAKGVSVSHERVLKQIGVDVIIKPEDEAGVRTAFLVTNPNFIKYSQSLQEIGDGYALGSTIVNNINWINKSLLNLKLNNWKVSIVSIKRKNKVIIPIGKTKLEILDLVTIIGKVSDLSKFFTEINN